MAPPERRTPHAASGVGGLWITREQERFCHDILGAAFVTRWRVVLSDLWRGDGETLQEAAEALLAQTAAAAPPVTGPEAQAMAGVKPRRARP